MSSSICKFLTICVQFEDESIDIHFDDFTWVFVFKIVFILLIGSFSFLSLCFQLFFFLTSYKVLSFLYPFPFIV